MLCHFQLGQNWMLFLLTKRCPYVNLSMLSQSDIINQSRREKNEKIQKKEMHERLKSKKEMVSKEK